MAIAETELDEKAEPRKFGNPPNHRRFQAIRSIKMLVPRCQSNQELGFEGCQAKHNRKWAWWEDCKKRGHDPYYSPVPRSEKVPQLSEPDAQGRRKVLSYDEVVWWDEQPNIKQVQVTERVAGDRYGLNSVEFARRAGCIMPGAHPTKPVAEFCEFHNCWCQDIKVRSRDGNFCNDEALRLVRMDKNELPLEVFDQRRMRRQAEGEDL